MTYQEALRYLDSFVNYEKEDNYNYNKSIKLDRMRRLAGLLGDPHRGIRSIHIAGTKGKGSTAAFIYSILKSAGFRVGLYTSPHLISFRERIRINDEFISEEAICNILERIRVVADSIEYDKPSFFEIYTSLAYLYFKEKKVDFAVYEVGLGGRLDATNIIEPLVLAITPISYEHTQKLGATLREIAAEKCGIIKEGNVCVSAPQAEEVLTVIKEVCEEKRTKLILVGKDILFEELDFDQRKELFNVFGMFGEYPILETGLLGSHQVVNAATSIGIAETLRFRGIIISADAIRDGIKNARWEGRLEIVKERPFVVLDGAQNRASADALAEAVKKIFYKKSLYKKLILILGVSNDKDIKGILEELLPIADSVILTKSRVIERAMDPNKIKEFIHSKNIIITTNVEEALDSAYSMAAKDDFILVTGSLFVIGETKEIISRMNRQLVSV